MLMLEMCPWGIRLTLEYAPNPLAHLGNHRLNHQ